jgi:carbon monoxide dehydrogenase subunit G
VQLENSFTVPVPVDEAWRVLLDIERIAPCMPSAALDSVDGDDFTGRVKVKLGPINLTYQGKASFIEKDEAAHRAVIDARGKDQRGNGTAAATVTANLVAEGSITRVDVLTDLNITGRPAQFGRGMMVDVGGKLLGQFADRLASQLGGGGDMDPARPGAEGPPAVRAAERLDHPADPVVVGRGAGSPSEDAAVPPESRLRPVVEPEPIDLLEVAGGAAMTRYAASAAGVAGAVIVLVLVIRHRAGRRRS